MSRKFDARQRTMEEMLGKTNVTTVYMSELSADPLHMSELSPEPEATERFEIHGPYSIGNITKFVLCNDVPCKQPMCPFIVAPRLTPARLTLFAWMCTMEEECLKSGQWIRNVDEPYSDWLSRYEVNVAGRLESLMNRVLSLPTYPTLKHYKALLTHND